MCLNSVSFVKTSRSAPRARIRERGSLQDESEYLWATADTPESCRGHRKTGLRIRPPSRLEMRRAGPGRAVALARNQTEHEKRKVLCQTLVSVWQKTRNALNLCP